MSANEEPFTIHFRLEPPGEGESLYRVSALAPGSAAPSGGELSLRGVKELPLERLVDLNPWQLRAEGGGRLIDQLTPAAEAFPASVEVSLPPGPAAVMDWEGLPEWRVLRRPLHEPEFTAARLTLPLRWGVVSVSGGSPAEDAFGITRLIRRLAPPQFVELSEMPSPPSLDALLRQAETDRLHGLHILLVADFAPDGWRYVNVGGDRIRLDAFIREIASAGARFVVLHSINPDLAAGIAALRWDSPNLPSESNTALMLVAGQSAAPATLDALERVYQNVFQDAPLAGCGGWPSGARPPQVYASAVANAGIRTALDILSTTETMENRLWWLRERRGALESEFKAETEFKPRFRDAVPPSRGGAPLRFESAGAWDAEEPGVRYRKPHGEGDQAAHPLERLGGLQEMAEAEKRALLPAVRTVLQEKSADPSQPRYPVALFHKVTGEGEPEPVPKIMSLSPPEAGAGLELHFWIDIVPGGIDYLGGAAPAISAPERAPYPVTLHVEVWADADDFVLQERHRELILEAAGPTRARARFPVELPPPQEIPADGQKRGDIYLFLLHPADDGGRDLVAVFRVSAFITRQSREAAQVIEEAYLASDWFRFTESAVGSAATIFLAKKAGHLQVFTLTNTEAPWGRLGADEQVLYQLSQKIYRHLHSLSLRAARAEAANKELSFSKAATGLAGLGYELYSTLFYAPQTDDSVMDFGEQFLAGLPEHSSITIALNLDTSRLMLPWGLIYGEPPPPPPDSDASALLGQVNPPRPGAFWGVRYNLIVRPPTRHARGPAEPHSPVRVGAAWYSHVETEELEKGFKRLEEAGAVTLRRLRMKDQAIPDLAAEEFDLVYFYCHGHTSLPGKEPLDAALVENYDRLAAASGDAAVQRLSRALHADPPTPSFILLDGGMATLPVLQARLRRLPGRPIVLLSMCESAQVTCAGTGFVTLFLDRGARSVIGTEGPTLWTLGREMDTQIIRRLLAGQTIGRAFSETRREMVRKNALALIYSLFGDAGARLASPAETPSDSQEQIS
jgi:hypothetical protein